jgi:predicted nucleic acid-binding protein
MEKRYAIIILGADNIPNVSFIGNEEEAKAKYLMTIHQYDEIKKIDYDDGYAYECLDKNKTVKIYLAFYLK